MIILSGLNHKTAPVEIREQLAFSREEAKQALRELLLATPLKEAVLLSTCNRTEIYGVVDDSTPWNGQVPQFLMRLRALDDQNLSRHFYHATDEEAIRHLFRVVSGLDSMVLGEAQILGQVKEAYLWAREAGTTDTQLNKLFHHAFRTGKRVRTETRIGEGSVSVGSVAVDLARKIFGEFRQKTILVMGAGEMAQQTLTHLSQAGGQQILVTNRTRKKAEDLAGIFAGTVISWEKRHSGMEQADVIIVSTGAKRPIVTREQIRNIMARRKNRPLFLIDISVPRNVEAATKDLYNVYLYDIDDLQNVISHNLAERQKEIPKAEKIIEEELQEFLKWFDSIPAIQLIQQLQEHFERIRQQEVKRYRKYFMKEDWEQVDRFSRSLLKKFLHSPIVRLRTCPDQSKLCSGCTVKDVFGLEVECQNES
jgi:glutamyl-tRNA reductase